MFLSVFQVTLPQVPKAWFSGQLALWTRPTDGAGLMDFLARSSERLVKNRGLTCSCYAIQAADMGKIPYFCQISI